MIGVEETYRIDEKGREVHVTTRGEFVYDGWRFDE